MTSPQSSPSDARVVGALSAALSAADLESVSRPLLAALNELTGLESTYLTSIDLDDDVQRIVYALNTEAGFEIPEGLEVTWSDTLCRRAIETGRVYTHDVPAVWGDSDAARELGIQTYASAPVVLPDGRTFGTLCGASAHTRAADEQTTELLSIFSRVIADAISREQRVAEAREQAAWAQEQLKSRSRVLATAEHELKTPLAVISGWSRMLEEGAATEEQTEMAIRSIVQQTESLWGRLNRMLEQARADVIASELSLEHLDLWRVVEPVVQCLKGLSPEHEIVIETRHPATAFADLQAMEIIVEHLVENAVKHTPGGRITCRIDQADGRALLVVRDEGGGLPDNVDIFEAFSRGSRDVPGSGLGLNIVRSLAEAMGGEVTAENVEGGAAFTVSLPQPTD